MLCFWTKNLPRELIKEIWSVGQEYENAYLLFWYIIKKYHCTTRFTILLKNLTNQPETVVGLFSSPFRTEKGVGRSLLPAFLLKVASFEASISEMRQMVYPLKYQLIQSRSKKRETALLQLLYYAMPF